MGKEQTDQDEKEQTEKISREERIERIQRLLDERGKDAANVVRMWLHGDEDKK